jgi:hypothetical protein
MHCVALTKGHEVSPILTKALDGFETCSGKRVHYIEKVSSYIILNMILLVVLSILIGMEQVH